MLSGFQAPPTVTCFLCKAWISVKKGDKSRFFNHVSNDHEVHFDLELLFVISYMTETEKDTVISLMNQRLSGDTEEEAESEVTPETEMDTVTLEEEETELAKVREIMKKKWRKGADNNIVISSAFSLSSEAGTANKGERELPEAASAGDFVNAGLLDVDINESHSGDSGEVTEVMCSRCPSRVTRRTIKRHMQEQHKMRLCRFCEKYMGMGNFARHLRNQHQKTTDDHDKISKLKSSSETSQVKEEKVQKNSRPDGGADSRQADKSKFKRCKLCFKITSVQNFERHLREKHTGVRHKCHLCYINFSRQYSLKNHVQTNHYSDRHLLDTNFKPTFKKEDCKVECQSCTTKFITEESKELHVMKSHGNGTRQCDNCQKRFMGSLSLKKHLESCNPISAS